MRNVSDKSCKENQNTHFMFNNIFRKIAPFMRCEKKYFRVGQTTDDTAQAHCTLDTKGYKHTLGICDRYIPCTATMIARRRLSVTLTYIDYVVFRSWFFRGKTARTFMEVTSSSPTLHNNPLRYRRIPLRIVCYLCHPIITNTTILRFVVWNKLFSEAAFSRMRDLSWFWEERRKPVLSFFGTFHVDITSPWTPKSNDRMVHISRYKNIFVASGLVFLRVPASVRHWGIR